MKMRNWDVIGKSKIFFTISGALMALILLVTLIFGPELSIQFKGGTIINYSYTGDVIDSDEAEALVEKALGEDVTIQSSQGVTGQTTTLTVSLVDAKAVTAEKVAALTKALTEAYPDQNMEQGEGNTVGASMGTEFLLKCLAALLVASLMIILYIGLRFKKIGGWSAGAMAIVGLLHDVIIMYGVYLIFRFPINDVFMAALLTILGYSINDTIVVYDRIRENKTLYGNQLTTRELVNKSINQSLGRTVFTTATTLAAMVVVAIVSLIAGIDTIFQFSFAISIGMISGVYSTIGLAGPLWVLWLEYREKHGKAPKAKKKSKKK
ncbi:MAG: protein translocase subunit SecF [Ruminococcaceae bacterium]|nr:protein translocase subunit SecF [Oscillospiraceae bacterium]